MQRNYWINWATTDDVNKYRIMKKGEAIFEHVLMAITVLLGIPALNNDYFAFAFIYWLPMFAFGQLSHSYDIARTYWKNKSIRTAIIIYWMASGTYLSILFSGITLPGEVKDYPLWVWGLPLCIAVYLWFTTWYFREKKQNRKARN